MKNEWHHFQIKIQLINNLIYKKSHIRPKMAQIKHLNEHNFFYDSMGDYLKQGSVHGLKG